MSENINMNFDEQFKNIQALKWLPWVGKDFSNLPEKRKLLVVAESHYDWHEEGSLEDLEYPEFTRWFIEGHTISAPNNPTKVIRNTERALFYDNPTNEQKIGFWQSVSYYNIVQRAMESINERPNDLDYSIGWDTFFKVINILQPDYVLFCGVEASNHTYHFNQAFKDNNFTSDGIQWLDMIGNTYSRIAELNLNDNYNPKLVFIKHPSKYFSWENWAEFIDKEMNDYTTWLRSKQSL